ncbi:hypothetical protein GLYMA_01G132100v4 [Glycine max]|uniref:Uncharacterized protein n=1 Tax=Glycine max TaxID=3847 RepID=K7K3L2_SOYBN|nr:hypothetical protein JHK85_001673 [Glycine max]KAH1162909.1 hypothetical protein GYH30_001433 [Glycine max]KRH76110.1 hypothetical protein GLYMA_01G132100v4 [Glycine max]
MAIDSSNSEARFLAHVFYTVFSIFDNLFTLIKLSSSSTRIFNQSTHQSFGSTLTILFGVTLLWDYTQ